VRWLHLFLLAALFSCSGAGGPPGPPCSEPEGGARREYRSGIFYEIFPRSFQDSDGDGIGDLQGIRQRIGYLRDMEVSAIWLNPIHPSPLFDSGYDVADYRAVHPDLGTLEDFEALLQEAHRNGIGMVLDLVFNHTSEQHPWFVSSRSSRRSPHRDWYLWEEPPFSFDCPDPLAFQFGTERWTLDPRTDQYYFHHFRPQMPDLNFGNPAVRAELLDVARFWLEKGVDGFRLDVAHKYLEDPEGCAHLPGTHAFLQELRALTDAYPARHMVGEVMGTAEETAAYLGNGRDELHMIFNFNLVYTLYAGLWLQDARWVEAGLRETWARFPQGGWQAVLLGNHDFFRVRDLMAGDVQRLKLAATLLMALPGTPFLYYGDEIGMANGRTTVIDYRDAARTPMPWDESPQAGFTDGTPWIPLAPGWETTHVKAQQEDPDSLWNAYRRLLRLRNRTAALHGDEAAFVAPERRNPLLLLRGKGEDSVLAVLNLTGREIREFLDLRPIPWPQGPVRDLLRDEAAAALTPENREAYPIHLGPYGAALLQPGP